MKAIQMEKSTPWKLKRERGRTKVTHQFDFLDVPLTGREPELVWEGNEVCAPSEEPVENAGGALKQ